MPITHVLSAAFVGLAVFCIVVIQSLNAWYDEAARNPQTRKRKRRARTRSQPAGSDLFPVPDNVMALVRNKKTAWRLYDEVESRYPQQSKEWIWDKVRWDIIRDRR